MRTYYEELEVSRTASAEVIRAAYRQLMQMYHPDKNPDDPLGATEASSRVNRAYEVLSDPELRAAYDTFLQQQESGVRDEPPSPPPPPERQHHNATEAAPVARRGDRVAFWHRILVLSVAADLITAFALGENYLRVRLLLLPVYVFSYSKLAATLGKNPWLYLLLGIIPIVNLFVLLVLVRGAYGYYASHGMKARFFGGAVPRGA